MVIFLPLSSFSAKIILTEYGSKQPITPGRADWLSDVIRIDRSQTRFTLEEESVIGSGIQVKVPGLIAEQIKSQGLRLGIVIHRLHLENLSRHMVACAMRFPSKGLAMSALRDFYTHYGISDDDFSLESAYREYSRFRKKFFANPATNKTARVLSDSRIWQRRDNTVNHINHEGLDALCRILDTRLESSRIRRHKVLARQAYIFIYAVRGGRDIGEISRRFKVHRANVYRAIARIKSRLRQDRHFSRVLSPIIDPLFVLPAAPMDPDICTEMESGLAFPSREHASTPKTSEAAPFQTTNYVC
jgi:hypothetical protein